MSVPRRRRLINYSSYIAAGMTAVAALVFVVLALNKRIYSHVSAAPNQWTFSDTSNFIFDDSKIQFSGGVARLISLDQTDDDSTTKGFAGGSLTGLQWNSGSNWLEKSVADTNAGTLLSRVMDGTTSTNWDSLAWVSQRPTWKELPDNQGVETAYGAGNANMTGNLSLLHLNETVGATSFADTSGNGASGSCSGGTCPTLGQTGRFNQAPQFDGVSNYISLGDLSSTENLSAFTVEGWINPAKASTANAVQPLLEKWSTTSTMATSSFSFFDTAANVTSTSKGFQSGIFDGRYVYFVPHNNLGVFVRYDTTQSFSSASAYSFFDTGTVDVGSRGLFTGAVFDGRYIYLIPITNGASVGGQITRYDTQGSFTDPASYSVFDTATVNANSKGFEGGVFDGRYVYLAPNFNGSSPSGQITRYDTRGSFTDPASYAFFDTGAVNSGSVRFFAATFDGRYLYLVPLLNGVFTQYDTQAPFTSTSSYSFFDTTAVNANSRNYFGSTFDGRYVYLIPDGGGSSGLLARYDTQAAFTSTSSYSFFDTTAVNANSKGFLGSSFDGRYLYLIPNFNTAIDGQITRYDTTQDFNATSSYSFFDMASLNASAQGFFGGVYDGRYLYFIPNANSAGSSGLDGLVARYDTTNGDGASYALRYASQGDGFSSALPGLTAMLNTSAGTFSASEWATSASNISANAWHHVAMTYDGANLKLYVDGVLKKTASASGTISSSAIALTLGAFNGGSSKTYQGLLDEPAFYSRALSSSEILDRYLRGALRLKFQVRSCSDSSCTTGTLAGPDGTASTFYSEQTNSGTSTPMLSLIGVTPNRYFQYKSIFETDTANYSPQLKSGVIGPAHYSADSPTISNSLGQTYQTLNSFSESLGAGNQGSVTYQLSNDSAHWYYWNGSQWAVAAGSTQANSAAEVNANIGSFTGQAGSGNFFFKAFFLSTSGTQAVELAGVSIGANQGGSPGGGGGGGSPISPPLLTPTTMVTSSQQQTDLQNLIKQGIAVHALIKLSSDRNPLTQEDSTVYYIGTDGLRHAFSNAKIFFTWYDNFSEVRTVSPAQLLSIPRGVDVSYKPGVRMVKFSTSPKVYAVSKGGFLRWIKTEDLARQIYGPNWNQLIDDIPDDAFHTGYALGPDIGSPTSYDPEQEQASVTFISDDFGT